MNEKALLRFCRDTIHHALDDTYAVDIDGIDPTLNSEKRATFVTLTLGGALRGCIGSIIPHRNFLDDLKHNAFAAAFHDPRFAPLQLSELEAVTLEISILTRPQEVAYRDEEELRSIITPFEDGVIIEKHGKQATFLPQVWEELPDFDTFFAYLGEKAGLGTDVLRLHPTVKRYQVMHFKES